MLGWTRPKLADKAGIGVDTLLRIENGQSDPRASTLDSIQGALEAAGIEFVGNDTVRLLEKKPPAKPARTRSGEG
jgi:transcriptional regulator with XRE-family HTH domain